MIWICFMIMSEQYLLRRTLYNRYYCGIIWLRLYQRTQWYWPFDIGIPSMTSILTCSKKTLLVISFVICSKLLRMFGIPGWWFGLCVFEYFPDFLRSNLNWDFISLTGLTLASYFHFYWSLALEVSVTSYGCAFNPLILIMAILIPEGLKLMFEMVIPSHSLECSCFSFIAVDDD